MKKSLIIALLLLFAFSLAACSSSSSDITLDSFKEAFTTAGLEMTDEDVPLFQLIDAKAGIMFYINNEKVAIYEYDSSKALSNAKKDTALLSSMVANGKFLLETNNEQVKEIFSGVK